MEYKLVIDIKSFIPMLGRYGLDMGEYFNMMDATGVVVWDSSDEGMEPKIIRSNFKEAQLLDMGKLTDVEREKLLKALKNGEYDLFSAYKK